MDWRHCIIPILAVSHPVEFQFRTHRSLQQLSEYGEGTLGLWDLSFDGGKSPPMVCEGVVLETPGGAV